MVLKFKDRSSPKNKIRIHVCGLTGQGKSTFADEYCKQVGLNPIVIDIDDTNYVTPANPEIYFIGNDRQVFDKICKLIDEINRTDYDTIIYDGFDSSMEKITPKMKERNPFWHLNIRKQRCEIIMNKLLNSGKHLIFIGQLDSKIEDNPEEKPSYPIKTMNNCVNVSYFCYVNKNGEFLYDIMKNRFGEQLKGLSIKNPIPYIVKQKENNIVKEHDAPKVEKEDSEEEVAEKQPIIKEKEPEVQNDDFVTANEIPSDEFVDDPVRNQCLLIKDLLEKEGVEVTKSSMRSKVIKLIKDGTLPKANRPGLIKYIDQHCPEGLN
jgi:adenylate kinase family enzyme